MNRIRILMLASAIIVQCITATAQDIVTEYLGEKHAMMRVHKSKSLLLIPIEEKEDNAHLDVIADNKLVHSLNARLAIDKVDYYVPVDISAYGDNVLLDITFQNDRHKTGSIKSFVCWKESRLSDDFDTSNRERFRPAYHHTPAYGWMNDPNGMFYKDGVWHLYYQHNPYGSQWENMSWGHSVSTDLINWHHQPEAIIPDALGAIFSGCCVVDYNNTAGFGSGAVVAFYTSAKSSQKQCMAYSTDDGKTFTKYSNNPILTADIPDFRDPHVFWHNKTNKWIMLVSAGQEMRIYSSSNLKEWKYESSFGQGYGNHDGVWECPDLMQLPVKSTSEQKWLLICNINPGGPFGGSSTQYFIGQFDGHKFTCESEPKVTKWMDYGKDHYATVSFDNAPNDRHVAMAWMSNWQYANQMPTKQYRSANSLPRDLGLFTDGKEVYVSVLPSPEMSAARGKKIKNLADCCEVVMDIDAKPADIITITLQNKKGEKVLMTYDIAGNTFSTDRTKSGDISFSNEFPAVTTAPTHGVIRQLRIFIDRSSIEVFDADGKMSMTNIMFPNEPYNTLNVKSNKKSKIKQTIYYINNEK